MVAKYGTGTYGTDVYSFGYTDFTGLLAAVFTEHGDVRKTLTFGGTLTPTFVLKGDLNRAGTQQFEGTITVDVDLTSVFGVSRGMDGTLSAVVGMQASELRNIIQRLSGSVAMEVVLSGHPGVSHAFGGEIIADIRLMGYPYLGHLWNEETDPGDPWVPAPPETDWWTPIERPAPPWN